MSQEPSELQERLMANGLSDSKANQMLGALLVEAGLNFTTRLENVVGTETQARVWILNFGIPETNILISIQLYIVGPMLYAICPIDRVNEGSQEPTISTLREWLSSNVLFVRLYAPSQKFTHMSLRVALPLDPDIVTRASAAASWGSIYQAATALIGAFPGEFEFPKGTLIGVDHSNPAQE